MKFLKLATSIGALNILAMALSFFSSILIVRILGADIYGKYIYIIAIISSLPIWYISFDQVLVKFGSVESVENKIQYVKGIIVLKTMIFFAVLIFLIMYLYFFEKEFLNSKLFLFVILVLIVKQLVDLVQKTFATIVNVYEKYLLLSFTTVAKSIIYAMFISLMYFLEIESKVLLYYICIFTLIASFVTLFMTIKYANNLLMKKYSIFHVNIIDIRTVLDKDKLKYFGPLQLVSIQSYLKKYLPQLLLGNMSSFSDVAYFEILRKSYQIIHKFIPKMMDLFFPSLIIRKKRDENKFTIFLKNYSKIYFLFVSLLSISIFIFSKQLLTSFDLQYTFEAQQISFILSLNLIVLSISYFYNVVQRTSSSTKYIFYGTTMNSILGSLVMFYLINQFGIIGAAMGILFGSVILSIFNIIGTYKYFKEYHIVSIYLLLSIPLLYMIFSINKG